MSVTRPFLTLQQICEIAQVDEHTVSGWIRSGQLRAVNLGTAPGKKIPRWRVPPEVWEEFLEARASSAKPKAIKRRTRKCDSEVTEFIK